MAILEDVPGLEVEIHVDGKPLVEYDNDEPDSPKTVTKYIEAITGVAFEIKSTFNPPFSDKYGVKTQIDLDGKNVRKLVCRKEVLFRAHKCSGAASTLGGQQFESQFRFAELNIVEDSSRSLGEQMKQALELTGLITVRFYFGKNISRDPNPRDSTFGTAFSPKTVPRKALMANALSHHATLDAAKSVHKGYSTSDYVDGKDHPFATFYFKYRSLASLKDLHVIPRTPSPTPLEDRRPEDLNLDERLELIRLLKAREAAAAVKIKNESNSYRGVKREHDDDDEVTVVSEKRVKNKHSTPQRGQEVIQLD